jgi:hypothetical protein
VKNGLLRSETSISMQSPGSKPLPFPCAIAALVRWVESCPLGLSGGGRGTRAHRARFPVDPGRCSPLDWLRVQSARQQVRHAGIIIAEN